MHGGVRFAYAAGRTIQRVLPRAAYSNIFRLHDRMRGWRHQEWFHDCQRPTKIKAKRQRAIQAAYLQDNDSRAFATYAFR